MVTCITVGHPHDKKAKAKVILGPDATPDAHIAEFKKLCASRSHTEFEIVQVISSNSGHIRSQRFLTPKESEARDAGRVNKAKLVADQGKEPEKKPEAAKPGPAKKA